MNEKIILNQDNIDKPQSSEGVVQNIVWDGFTDQEIHDLSSEVKSHVEAVQAHTKYKHTTIVFHYTRSLDLADLTGTGRLIDLGSADRIIGDIGSLLLLEESGIQEYISVDLAIGEDSEFKERELADRDEKPNPPIRRIRVQSQKKEILEALHSMPDNYGNICSMGVDPITFHLSKKWILAAFSEMKRVVPEGGIIFTDGMYLDDALEMCSPEYEKVKKICDRMSPGFGLTPADKEENELFLSKYKCNENDPYSKLGKVANDEEMVSRRPGVKYCVELPQIGFSVYFDHIDIMRPMFLVNTKKTRG